MKRRTSDPLAPLLPVLRLAAVGLVAAAGSLAAVHINANAVSTSPAASVTQADYSPGQIPVTAKLVALPVFAGSGGPGSVSATVTDPAEISRVAQLIDGLKTVPRGAAYSCPMDNGSGLELNFESADGTVDAQVKMDARGCGFASVTVDGTKQLSRWGGDTAIQQIQSILGTHWQITTWPSR